jgi:hypothetical protein
MLPALSPAGTAALVWKEEEDLLALHFYYDQESRRGEMGELLGRKNIDCLIERYRFMNLAVSTALQEALKAIATQKQPK